jgi:hypothetical protein
VGVEWTNPRARQFYERGGYVPAGREHDVTHFGFEGRDQVMDVDQQILRKLLGRAVLA